MNESTEIVEPRETVPERTSERAVATPPVDIYENDDEILVIADMPGVPNGGVSVLYEKDVLTIEGSIDETNDEPPRPLFREFSRRDFRRLFQLAPVVDVAKVVAEVKDGILTVRMPKNAAVKPRTIPITSG